MITILMKAAMKNEREHVLKAVPYERSEERTGSSNGYKDKTISTRQRRIELNIYTFVVKFNYIIIVMRREFEVNGH